MAVYFQSLCSSSSGNCLTLWTDTTRLVFDCGLASMKRTRAVLTGFTEGPARPDAVIVSHAHSDHISHYPLRVIEQLQLPVHIHRQCLGQLQQRFLHPYGFGQLILRPFDDEGFSVGEFTIRPFKLDHHPEYATYGFTVECRSGDETVRMVLLTDFCQWKDIAPHLVDADFIFVESNHDLEMLRRYYNPNSRFHLSNPQTAELLCHVRGCSCRAPTAVMLGHISSQRNEPRIAIRETTHAFRKRGIEMDFELMAAPLKVPSAIVTIR